VHDRIKKKIQSHCDPTWSHSCFACYVLKRGAIDIRELVLLVADAAIFGLIFYNACGADRLATHLTFTRNP
jgi:hypothetical protein